MIYKILLVIFVTITCQVFCYDRFNVIDDPLLSSLLDQASNQNIDLQLVCSTRASQTVYEKVSTVVYADVAASYIMLRKTQNLILLSKRNECLQERRKRMFMENFKAGKGTSLEIGEIESKLAQAKALTISLEGTEKNIIYHLSVLLGSCPETLLDELKLGECDSFYHLSVVDDPLCNCNESNCNLKSCIKGNKQTRCLLYKKMSLKRDEESYKANESFVAEQEKHDLLLEAVKSNEKAYQDAQVLFTKGAKLSLVLNAEQSLLESQQKLFENEAEQALMALKLVRY